MTARLKGLVSKNKKRFQEDNFDLDLTYIRKDIIAMGVPAQNLESVYRNKLKDVVRFFETRHKGHYRIYNLCNERQHFYDASRFEHQVAKFPFNDHNPPELLHIRPFCEDVQDWLNKDPKNVAAIHCKAGKGRTGLMIAAYFLHSHFKPNAREALEFFGTQRTNNSKGVTIPSQRRYVEYYGELVKKNFAYEIVTLELKSIYFEPIPNYAGGISLQFNVSDHKKKLFQSQLYEIKRSAKYFQIDFNPGQIRFAEDVRFDFINCSKMSIKNERMFSLWFNTYFIKQESLHKHDSISASSIISNSSSSNSSSSSLNSSTHVPANKHNHQLSQKQQTINKILHNNNNQHDDHRLNTEITITPTTLTVSPVNNSVDTNNSVNNRNQNNKANINLSSSLSLSPSLIHKKNISPKIRLNGETRNSFNGNSLIANRTSVFNDINTSSTSDKLSVKTRERYKSGPAQMDQIYNDIRFQSTNDTEEDYVLVLKKEELDKANKKGKNFMPDHFKIILRFRKISSVPAQQLRRTASSPHRSGFAYNSDGTIDSSLFVCGYNQNCSLGNYPNNVNLEDNLENEKYTDTDTDTDTDEECGG